MLVGSLSGGRAVVPLGGWLGGNGVLNRFVASQWAGSTF